MWIDVYQAGTYGLYFPPYFHTKPSLSCTMGMWGHGSELGIIMLPKMSRSQNNVLIWITIQMYNLFLLLLSFIPFLVHSTFTTNQEQHQITASVSVVSALLNI